jgi:hypothetical protein
MRPTPLLSLLIIGQGLCPAPAFSREPLPVSILQLLANPQEYDRKLVCVVGYLSLGEQRVLYLHHEDAYVGDAANAISIRPTQRMLWRRHELNHKYVVVVGTFRAGRAGSPVWFMVGGIRGIKRCSVWSPPAGYADP